MTLDCQEVEDRMAALLDAELSPGEAELVGRHLDACPSCAALLSRMEGQSFPRPTLPAVDAPGFWDRMESRLQAERREIEAVRAAEARAAETAGARPAWWRRELRLSPATVMLYAALLLLAFGLAAVQSLRVDRVQGDLAHMEQRMEREQRLAATPGPALPVEPVGALAQVPFRGSL